MILLDTNVLSALVQSTPDATVLRWLDLEPRDSVWITSVTVMEVRYGLHTMPAGRKRDRITRAFEILMDEKIQGRVASFDTAVAEQTAELMAARKQRGHPQDYRDTMIAGIVLSSKATLATRNTAHFEDLSVRMVNPWKT